MDGKEAYKYTDKWLIIQKDEPGANIRQILRKLDGKTIVRYNDGETRHSIFHN